MKTNRLLTLEITLKEIDKIPWDLALYIPATTPNWQPNMPVMIINPDETEDPDEDPEEAKKQGLKYALMISDAQDVIENVRMQCAKTSIDILIKALKHYYDNNSFINLNSDL